MRTATIITIVAATAAGLIAATILYFTPLTRTISGSENQQKDLLAGVETTANNGYKKVHITVNGVGLVADIAATSVQQSKGLAVKDTLSENEAMLFVFSKASEQTFWMKNMKFPIDIIWLDPDRKVVHIEHSLEPCVPDSVCPTYRPNDNSLYVLETVAGFAQKYNVTQGTLVQFKLEE